MYKAITLTLTLYAIGPAMAEEGRTDWMPNARTGLAVHWDQPLEDAQKEFEARGYEGISDFEYYPFSDERNCSAARRVASDRATGRLEGCYAYVDGGPFAGAENTCRIYRFRFERYAGAERRDPQHPRNCHNMR